MYVCFLFFVFFFQMKKMILDIFTQEIFRNVPESPYGISLTEFEN